MEAAKGCESPVESVNTDGRHAKEIFFGIVLKFRSAPWQTDLPFDRSSLPHAYHYLKPHLPIETA